MLHEILLQVDKSIHFPFGDERSFAIDDLIQILKEMRHISRSASASGQHLTLVQHGSTSRILLKLLTRDYLIEPKTESTPSPGAIDVSRLVALMQSVCGTLSNIITDEKVADDIMWEYNILNILN